MLRGVLRGIEALLLGLVGYNLVVAVFGWRDRPPSPPDPAARRFRVVVPAHDEERVLPALLADLAAQDHPSGLVSVWVLADRCSDRTAQVAKEAGVSVAERVDGPDGKGAALAWYLAAHPLDDDEDLVVVDADNRVPPGLLSRFSAELSAGHYALQACLDVANPGASAVATASALSYWASNRMVDLARTNLGWPATLGGTGMCLSARALEAAGGFGTAAAEDQEMAVRLLLAGIPVVWLHDVRVLDEKPVSAGVAVRQRARWAGGRRQVARRYWRDLARSRAPGSIDMLIRLVQPSRMGVALVSAVLAAVSAVGVPLLPWRAWATAAAIQLAAPIPFLVREGVPARYLVRYPLLVVLPVLKVAARLVRQEGWYHTPHTGESG